MNDLNSVFMVGRVTKKAEDGVNLANRHYFFKSETKEYEEQKTEWCVRLTEKHLANVDVGMRIGVNGRLSQDEGLSFIQAYSIQILEPVKGRVV